MYEYFYRIIVTCTVTDIRYFLLISCSVYISLSIHKTKNQATTRYENIVVF